MRRVRSILPTVVAGALVACGPPPGRPPSEVEPTPVAEGAVTAEEEAPEPAPAVAVSPAGASVACPDALEPGAERWSCAMHPQVREDRPGVCPICGMDLTGGRVLTEGTPPDVSEPPPYAFVTADGLATCVVRPGSGRQRPTPDDRVTVHYAGWTTDGQCFDSSVRRGRTATFPLHGVIEGWRRGVPLMVEGEVRRFWIPATLAYGDDPRPGAPAGMLVFDVELVAIEP